MIRRRLFAFTTLPVSVLPALLLVVSGAACIFPDSDKIRAQASDAGSGGSGGNADARPSSDGGDVATAQDSRGDTPMAADGGGDAPKDGGRADGTGTDAAAACTNPMPLYCPASGTYPGGCWESGIQCGSIVDCAGTTYACRDPNQIADCVDDSCLPAEQCTFSGLTKPCDLCLAHKCCTPFRTCLVDAPCLACSDASTACPSSSASPVWTALLACSSQYCKKECGL